MTQASQDASPGAAFRVVIATRPLALGPDAVVLNVVDRTITRGKVCMKFQDHGGGVVWWIIATPIIRAGSGQCICRKDLFDVLYGNREDGGPLHPGGIVSITMQRCRGRLERLGIGIFCQCSMPYRVVDLWAAEAIAA